jgi:multicomponent K+:H+ antiporter subunit G
MAHFTWAGAPQLHELLITVFVFMTAPVSAQLLVNAALHLSPGAAPPPPATSAQETGAPRIEPRTESNSGSNE